jgi:hypothetical protein
VLQPCGDAATVITKTNVWKKSLAIISLSIWSHSSAAVNEFSERQKESKQ